MRERLPAWTARFLPRWPRSLVGRVFALYTLALVGFVTAGVGLFIRYQFTVGLEEAATRADGLVLVMAPTVTDSAVIGDYDTIKRTLANALRNSDFAAAEYIDLRGSKLHVDTDRRPAMAPPDWLSRLIADRLLDTNQTISAGGRDYGVLRLTFAPAAIAGELWQQSLVALGLGLLALGGGLVAILVPLRRWLGDLDRLQSLDRSGEESLPVPDDAPTELRRTYETLIRAGREREAALTSLRRVLEGLLPGRPGERGDDLQAISQMISELTLRLRERGAQLDAIFALSPDGFVSFDAAHRVNYVSPSFLRLTGLPEDQLIGADEDTLLARWHAAAAPRAQQLLAFEPLRNAAVRHRVDVERPKRRVLELAVRQGDSAVVSQVLHVRDVTHETEVDQLKSEFLSTAAHELRTPMASIFGYVELLMVRRMSPERQQQALATVHRQTELMISIVNELLDLARIEARRGMDFEFESADLGALVRQCTQDFRVPEGRTPPRLVLPDAPAAVSVDRKKFAQALGNVLSNAYKYSPEGGWVDVAVATTARGAATVSVVDHGIGMSGEQLARVCERFWRADASGTIPGTGLGMAIVEEIVALLGGRLAITSQPGEGTQVRFELPLQADTHTAPAPLAA
jgi:PAS domain S-box-containing protein